MQLKTQALGLNWEKEAPQELGGKRENMVMNKIPDIKKEDLNVNIQGKYTTELHKSLPG